MDNEYIIRLIHEYNPHLQNKKFETPKYKRELYSEIEKFLDKKQIIAIVGLRRVGKTTIMRQLMENLNNVFFFSFDEEETQKKDVLIFVIDYLLNNFNAEHIFLDEIHYVEDWEGILKRYYDLKNTKFIISGSELLEISKAKQSLAGRIITFTLQPLKFREYLQLKGRNLDSVSIENFDLIEKLYFSNITEKEFYEKEFNEYLYKGGFPELVNEDDEKVIINYIREMVIKKIIYKDIPTIFEIRRKDLLYELFKYSCSNSANLFDLRNLCNLFSVNYETVSNYLSYLRFAFLVKIAETYSESIAKRIRRNKKIYVVHPSIAFAVLGYKKEMLIEKVLGQYVETIFAKEMFWRDKQKNEVDVILKNETILPIEVKYQSQITSSDLRGLLKFMKKFNVKKGVVITKNLFERRKIDGKEIMFVPAWVGLVGW